MHVRYSRTLQVDLHGLSGGSAFVWAGVWASAGYLLGGAVAEDPARFGILFSILMAGALAAAATSGLILMRPQAIPWSLVGLMVAGALRRWRKERPHLQ